MKNELATVLYDKIKYFIPRLLLSDLSWGDVVLALQGLREPPTSEADFWAAWANGWCERAVHYEKKAKQADAENKHITAKEAWLKTVNCLHWAEFMWFQETAKKEAIRERLAKIFERNPIVPPLICIEKITISYQDLFLPGYLLTPMAKQNSPCVILLNGLDSAKEVELLHFAKAFVARGMAAFIFDGLGQGVWLGKKSMPINFEYITEQCIHFLSQHPAIDPRQIGIFGVSFGGYLALRSSSYLGDRVKACVNLSGGSRIENIEHMPSRIQQDFCYVFQQSLKDLILLAREELNLCSHPSPTCPMLCIHGEGDHLFPVTQCQEIVEWCQEKVILHIYANEDHVCQHYFSDYIPLMADWMAEKLTVTK